MTYSTAVSLASHNAQTDYHVHWHLTVG